MHDLALARFDPVPESQHSQREVGVLTVGSGKPLIEPADLLEDGTAIGHVGRRITSGLEPLDVALPVGRPAIGRQRHSDPAL